MEVKPVKLCNSACSRKVILDIINHALRVKPHLVFKWSRHRSPWRRQAKALQAQKGVLSLAPWKKRLSQHSHNAVKTFSDHTPCLCILTSVSNTQKQRIHSFLSINFQTGKPQALQPCEGEMRRVLVSHFCSTQVFTLLYSLP